MKQFLAKHGYSWLLTIAVGFGLWTLKMNVKATTEEQLRDYTRSESFLAYVRSHDDTNVQITKRYDQEISNINVNIAEIRQSMQGILTELIRRPPPPPLRSPKDTP